MQKTNFLIVFALIANFSPAFAQTTTPVAPAPLASADIPLCKPLKDAPPATPCILEDKDSGAAVTNMIFGNQDGFKKLNAKAHVGFQLEAAMVTLLSITDDVGQGGKSVIKYDIILDDCRNTDECAGHVLWSVTETNTSDGYVNQETFVNSLAPDLGHEIIDFTDNATQVDVVKAYLHDFGPAVNF